jgi:hypothetical protein
MTANQESQAEMRPWEQEIPVRHRWRQHGKEVAEEGRDEERFAETQRLLGEPDPVKRFLAALLVSLLHAQTLGARRRAESHAK